LKENDTARCNDLSQIEQIKLIEPLYDIFKESGVTIIQDGHDIEAIKDGMVKRIIIYPAVVFKKMRSGVICVSDDLTEAMLLAVFVEETAKTQFITLMLNSVED
jgi:hypothetical protein